MMSMGNAMRVRTEEVQKQLLPDNVTVAPKGSIKIGQLCWRFGCWNCRFSCESCFWASGFADSDQLMFTQRLWRGGKVGFAPSRSFLTLGVTACSSGLCESTGGQPGLQLRRSAIPGLPPALQELAPLLRFYGRYHLKRLKTTSLLGNSVAQWLRLQLWTLTKWVKSRLHHF